MPWFRVHILMWNIRTDQKLTKIKLIFSHKLKFIIPASLKTDGVNL